MPVELPIYLAPGPITALTLQRAGKGPGGWLTSITIDTGGHGALLRMNLPVSDCAGLLVEGNRVLMRKAVSS